MNCILCLRSEEFFVSQLKYFCGMKESQSLRMKSSAYEKAVNLMIIYIVPRNSPRLDAPLDLVCMKCIKNMLEIRPPAVLAYNEYRNWLVALNQTIGTVLIERHVVRKAQSIDIRDVIRRLLSILSLVM